MKKDERRKHEKKSEAVRRRVLAEFSGSRIAEIEEAIETADPLSRRYLELLVRKKKLNDRSEKKKRAKEYFPQCLEKASKWTDTYVNLLNVLNEDGYPFSKEKKASLREAFEQRDGQ